MLLHIFESNRLECLQQFFFVVLFRKPKQPIVIDCSAVGLGQLSVLQRTDSGPLEIIERLFVYLDPGQFFRH